MDEFQKMMHFKIFSMCASVYFIHFSMESPTLTGVNKNCSSIGTDSNPFWKGAVLIKCAKMK